MSARSRWRFPDALVLIVALIALAQLLTYVLPAGQYKREGRKVVANTYKTIERPALPAYTFFTAIPKGMAKAADIIFFVFIVGGVIGVVRATGAIDALIAAAIRRLGNSPVLLVGGMTTLFALGSSSIGMAEEYMPFVPLLVTMCRALRMDAVVAMGIVYIGAGIGYGCAALNPFTVVIAQKIAGLPPTSGQWLRWLLLAGCLVIGVAYVLRYARRVREDPERSLVRGVDYSVGFELPEDAGMTVARLLVLLAFAATVVVFAVGVGLWGWYLTELAAIFIGLAIVAAVIARLGPNDVSKRFVEGAAELTGAALLIGFARTIQVVLDAGQVTDTVVHGIAGLVGGFGPAGAAAAMVIVQALINFFIPSGSGQAYVTMPIMTPLADVTGVSRQTAVLAYQFGDGFGNMIIPTNALLVGMLGLARVPYQRWVRFIGPLLLALYVIATLAIVLAVKLGYGR
ncbi:MAG: YfcC family protein [Myxococcales bacterium]|nr:YfcC family protein [Myxococcales bacterium]